MTKEDLIAAASIETPIDKDPAPVVEPTSDIQGTLAQVRNTLGQNLHTEHQPDYLSHPEMKQIIEKQKFAFGIVNAARKAGIPPELIDHYLYDFCVKQIALKNFKMVADLLRNLSKLKLVTPEVALLIEEYAAAQVKSQIEAKEQMHQAEQEDGRSKRIRLRPDATIGDLNRALSADDVVSDMHEIFIAALKESPQKEQMEALLDVWNTPKANTITIEDFFECDWEDLSEELPIDWINGNT